MSVRFLEKGRRLVVNIRFLEGGEELLEKVGPNRFFNFTSNLDSYKAIKEGGKISFR